MKNRKKHVWLVVVIVALVVVLAAAGGYWSWYSHQDRSAYEQYQFDTEAMAGRINRMTEAEIQEELNRVVEEGMFNISIASAIIIDPETNAGTANIENIAANRYYMQVDIFQDETGEKLYSSKLIKPGFAIPTIHLEKTLEPGAYPATAIFSAITQDEMKLYGTAGAQITIYVPDENGRIPTQEATVEPTASVQPKASVEPAASVQP